MWVDDHRALMTFARSWVASIDLATGAVTTANTRTATGDVAGIVRWRRRLTVAIHPPTITSL
jgi:hypothetical protein